ncbi:MAG: CopG family transcriptional regulator [Planctomycetes bacterium]|nr:CopG family transcriptional regulator [Planctomycetota bacterium]
MATKRPRVVSFKADAALCARLDSVPNRSEFIRSALMSALENACPLCAGSGILQPHQRRQWRSFSATHPRLECGRCHEHVFSCAGRVVTHACGS